ncbi:MAG: thiamine pyrophosphate-binding protein [Desulfobulbaceae bacterium]|nr:thiamine pyrophosphate-binding protein [Desulfobulbaceae bacterium]
MSHLIRLAEEIAASGVRRVFGIPGSGPSLTLLDALERNGVAFQLTHFEGTAPLMAAAGAKLSGKAGVVVAIKGPGLANLIPGMAACLLDSWPIVSISEATPPQTPPHVAHKRMDHARLVGAVSKFSCYWGDGSPRFSELAAAAEAEKPGPVHLNIAGVPVQEGALADCRPEEIGVPGLSADVRAQLLRAARPVVIAGTMAVRRGMTPRLNELACPVFTTAAAKGAVDEYLPHAAGVYTGAGGPLAPEVSIIPHADLLVGIGLRPEEVLIVRSFSCPVFLCDVVHSHSSGWGPMIGHCGADAASLGELFEVLAEKKWGENEVVSAQNLLCDHFEPQRFLPAGVMLRVANAFQGKIRVVLDTGNFCTVAEHVWRVAEPSFYLAAGQGRYMGVGIPLGLGATLHDPTVPTVVFVGDGGIGMYIAELKLAVVHNLPLLVILLSDGYLGTILGASNERGLSRLPSLIPMASWQKVVEGMGVQAERVMNHGQLEAVLSGWKRNAPLFIEAPFDPQEYQSMTATLR